MDNIQSWSAFDEQVQNNDVPDSSTAKKKGVDSLYVSKTSENVSPATVALLNQAGLTSSSPRIAASGSDNNMAEVERDEEFRLRFHWMRPHPSDVFSLEGEIACKKIQEEGKPLQTDNHDTHTKISETQQHLKPAVATAKMMRVYRDAKIKQYEKQMEGEEKNDTIMLEEETNHSKNGSIQSDEGKSVPFLPFEYPELRVDLPSLVEPPLMTSWLPSAESIDILYRNE